MADLVEIIRESRKSPAVLKHMLISIRSVRRDALVFIFEGQDDIGVYESWISRTTEKPVYEVIPGKGKEQLLALRQQLAANDPNLLRKVYFFVDCDFDQYDSADEHVFVLDAYSTENMICCPEAIESVLNDEYRCAGSPADRQRIIATYLQLARDFHTCSSSINFTLFAARRSNVRVLKKPEHADEIATITLNAVAPTFVDSQEIVELEDELEEENLLALRADYLSLSEIRAQRGKYVLSMLRRWLMMLAADRKSAAPILFSESVPNLPGEPWTISSRRFAMSSRLPTGLDDFVSRAVAA